MCLKTDFYSQGDKDSLPVHQLSVALLVVALSFCLLNFIYMFHRILGSFPRRCGAIPHSHIGCNIHTIPAY